MSFHRVRSGNAHLRQSSIPDLFTVRFACGLGGTGATEVAALADGIRTVRLFKGAEWVDALTQRFDGMPGEQVPT